MSSQDAVVEPGLDFSGVLGKAVSVASSDVRIPVIQIIATFLGVIPIVGSLVRTAVIGLGYGFADETLGGPQPQESVTLRFAFSIVSAVIIGIATVIGAIFLIIPGIYVALKLSLALPAIWIEGKGPIEALSDSWARTSGRMWTVLGVNALLFFIAFVALVAVLVAYVPLTPEGLGSINEQPIVFAYPVVFAAEVVLAATVGAVGTAAHAVMFRSYSTQGPAVISETEYEHR